MLGPRDIREACGYERDIGVDRQDAVGKIPNNPIAERRIFVRALDFRISPEFQDSGSINVITLKNMYAPLRRSQGTSPG
jgi:hypothetical protein